MLKVTEPVVLKDSARSLETVQGCEVDIESTELQITAYNVFTARYILRLLEIWMADYVALFHLPSAAWTFQKAQCLLSF